MKLPIITDLLGSYVTMEYLFTEDNFYKFCQIMENIIVDQQNSSENLFIPRIKFGISVNNVSIHAMCTFINRMNRNNPKFMQDKVELQDVDWVQLICNSQNANR